MAQKERVHPGVHIGMYGLYLLPVFLLSSKKNPDSNVSTWCWSYAAWYYFPGGGPFRRRRFGAGQLGAVPFRRRTFRRRFLFFYIFRVMKKKQ